MFRVPVKSDLASMGEPALVFASTNSTSPEMSRTSLLGLK
jgi:hypothetical protein